MWGFNCTCRQGWTHLPFLSGIGIRLHFHSRDSEDSLTFITSLNVQSGRLIYTEVTKVLFGVDPRGKTLTALQKEWGAGHVLLPSDVQLARDTYLLYSECIRLLVIPACGMEIEWAHLC